MVMVLVFFAVSILSSTAGSICGIGGGVIIKPVLDALGVMSVSSISFLSGCTVLAMSVVSVYKNLRSGTAQMDLKIATSLAIGAATSLAIGAAAGGVAGKAMFQSLKEAVGDENLVGMTQALVLIAITLATLLYTIYKEKIHTRKCDQIWLCVLIGLLLGIMSSFLGIGGGPINLMVLGYFFSMSTKEAALSSLYIILFSQITSLVQTCATGNIPHMKLSYLAVMIVGGILGGTIGSRINKKISEKGVDKLFIFLMAVIVLINIYNAVKFSGIL